MELRSEFIPIARLNHPRLKGHLGYRIIPKFDDIYLGISLNQLDFEHPWPGTVINSSKLAISLQLRGRTTELSWSDFDRQVTRSTRHALRVITLNDLEEPMIKGYKE